MRHASDDRHLGQRALSRVKGRSHDRIRTRISILQNLLEPHGGAMPRCAAPAEVTLAPERARGRIA
jgi:hypothetical protein